MNEGNPMREQLERDLRRWLDPAKVTVHWDRIDKCWVARIKYPEKETRNER